jgi:hypothetical protein
MSLAKYIDLLQSKTLFCPKASLFQDNTEGKWLAHASLVNQKKQQLMILNNKRQLEEILLEAKGNYDKLFEISMKMLNKLHSKNKNPVLATILEKIIILDHDKLEEYFSVTIENWTKLHKQYNLHASKWKQQTMIKRESTYISCWYRASSMSMAMWELYGGGDEAIAISIKPEMLEKLLIQNKEKLTLLGLDGQISKVKYIEGLNNPDKDLSFKLFEELNHYNDVRVGEFCVKPALYSYENEVRLILYPKSSPFDPIEDPNPERDSILLNIEKNQIKLDSFISGVHIHPLLNSNSMMAHVVKSINTQYGLSNLPIISDHVEPLGSNILI